MEWFGIWRRIRGNILKKKPLRVNKHKPDGESIRRKMFARKSHATVPSRQFEGRAVGPEQAGRQRFQNLSERGARQMRDLNPDLIIINYPGYSIHSSSGNRGRNISQYREQGQEHLTKEGTGEVTLYSTGNMSRNTSQYREQG